MYYLVVATSTVDQMETSQSPMEAREEEILEKREFTANDHVRLHMHCEVPIVRHTVVAESRSPYDGDVAYWSQRLSKHPMLKTEKGILLKRCKGNMRLTVDCSFWMEMLWRSTTIFLFT